MLPNVWRVLALMSVSSPAPGPAHGPWVRRSEGNRPATRFSTLAKAGLAVRSGMANATACWPFAGRLLTVCWQFADGVLAVC